jgi:hypothetical protein
MTTHWVPAVEAYEAVSYLCLKTNKIIGHVNN